MAELKVNDYIVRMDDADEIVLSYNGHLSGSVRFHEVVAYVPMDDVNDISPFTAKITMEIMENVSEGYAEISDYVYSLRIDGVDETEKRYEDIVEIILETVDLEDYIDEVVRRARIFRNE